MLTADKADLFDKYVGASFMEYIEQLDLTNITEIKEINNTYLNVETETEENT